MAYDLRCWYLGIDLYRLFRIVLSVLWALSTHFYREYSSGMIIVETIPELERVKKGCVLTVGNFDGVHLGHKEILAAAGQIAKERKTELTAMTFEPHPVAILYPEKAPGVLTPLALKKHMLAECGVDCLVVLKDSRGLLNLSPADFVEEFLVKTIHPAVVIEGENFNFGYGRSGNVYTLQSLGDEKGFEVSIIESKTVKLSIGQSVRVSSTIIRNMLEAGKVADAAVALGRAYRLIGQIIPGRGKGRKLGFATANMQPGRQIVPAEGVYAGRAQIGDDFDGVCAKKEKIPAAFSVGQASTYGPGGQLLIEAHLLVENVGDLIGKWMTMDFIKYIRGQEKFETEAELADQIAKDCEKAGEILVTEDLKS